MSNNYMHKPSKSKYISEIYSLARYSSPLKRSMSGYEVEMALIDENGDMNFSSKKIIDDVKKIDKNFPIFKEVGKNMIEVTAIPNKVIQKTAIYLLDNMKTVQDVCMKKKLFLFPLGTYPGKFKEQVWKKKRYKYPAKVLGEKKYFYYYSHCFGFHYHYELPKGLFNKKEKFLNKQLAYSRIKKSLVDSYNFLIASDPVIMTLAQSSPFEGGKYYAKDTRMLFLRGGEKLRFKGLYNKLQMLGGLPPYKQTSLDLIHTLKKKDRKFKKMLKGVNAPKKFIDKKDKLDFIWNPVKVNRLGTIEQRGMDINHLNICLGISVMIKFILRAIQQEFFHVIPSDVGINEPFKLEGNVIFVPPHTYVRNVLQYKCAYKGFSDKEIYNYCMHFYNLARKLIYKTYIPTVHPIKDMLDKRKTVSDQIVDYVKRKGYSLDDTIPKEICRKIALTHAEKMYKELDKTKSIYENLE